MSVLKTLYILFKNRGTEEVKKGQESVEKSTKKTKESLDKTDKALGDVQKEFIKLGKELLGFASLSGAVWGAFKGIKDAADYAAQLGIIAQNLQVNVTELDAWGNAVRRTGGTAEGFQSSLKNLSQRLYTTGENAMKVLPQLADAFQRMGRAAALRYGETLGLDEGTIMLLQRGRRELDAIIARQKELGLVTKHDAEVAREYNYAWQDTSHAFRSMFMAVAEEVLPVLIKVIEGFGKVAEYFREHADLIIGALIGIGAAAAIIAAPFIIANIGVIALIAGIAALIAIFALVFEDIKYFIEGNKSLIGDMLKRWPMVGKVVKAVFDDIKASFKWLFEVFKKVSEYIGKLTFGRQKMQIGVDAQGNAISGDTDFAKMQQSLNEESNSPLAAQTSNSITNSQMFSSAYNKNSANKNVTVNTGDIKIETQATNAEDVSAQFTKGFIEHLRQTTNTFDDGVTI